MKLVLKVTPEFCGPTSVGTVGLIKLLEERFGLSLKAAKQIVDRCVFDGETVDIPIPDAVQSTGLLEAIRSLETPAVVNAAIKES